MLRLVVTGARGFTDKDKVREYIFEAIEEYRATTESSYDRRTVNWDTLTHVTLIHGKAPGFDRLCAAVAKDCGMSVVGVGADWDGPIGRDAGTSRNWQLIREGKPNYGLVGPGRYGTGHMISALRKSAIPFLYKGADPIL